MYACLCSAVTIADVELTVVSGATTIEAIGEATDAGTGCGCCHPRLETIIERIGMFAPVETARSA